MLDELRLLDAPLWAAIVLVVLAVAVVTNDIVLGKRSYTKFRAAIETAPPEQAPLVRAKFLWMWAWQPWVLTLVAIAFVAVAPGITLSSFGFTWPDFSGLSAIIERGGPLGGALLGMLIGAPIVLLVGAIAGSFARPRSKRRSQQQQADEADARSTTRTAAVNPQVDAMLPTQREDRRAWVALSATAGIAEEIMYRGLIVLALALLLPQAPTLLVYAVAVIAFAIAHAYQEWAGVLSTGLLGAVFVTLYAATGSLLIGIVLHVLVDVRVVFAKSGSVRS